MNPRSRRLPPGWTRRVAAAFALACAAGWLLAALLPLDRWLERRHDWQQAWLAPAPPADAALVVDVDEASARQLGGWPLRRDAYVAPGRWLLANGARALVFGLLLVDAREGDEAFVLWLAEAPVPVLLAARSVAGDGAQRPAQAASPGCLAQPWQGWQLPPWVREGVTPAPLPIGRVGALSVPVDADGVLRRLPLWQQAGPLALPLLPVAAWSALRPGAAAAMHCVGERWGAAAWAGPDGTHWPLDGDHRLRPWLAAPAPAALPLARIDDAAAGRLSPGQAQALAQAVRGRVIFIGSSATAGDQLVTVHGLQGAAEILAGTYDALAHGRLLAPAGAAAGAALMAVGLLPLAALWRRGRLRLAADLGWIAAAAGVLLLVDLALLAQAARLVHVGAPLAMLGALAALALWAAQREARAEHQRLLTARIEAETATRVKGEFLAHMSHEIRTPLHALLGAAELLAQTRLDARQARHVAMFQGAGQELLQMLGDLLDLSKIEAGLMTLDRQPFVLPRLVAAQLQMFEPRALQKGLTLRLEADPELPDVVVGDAARLAQVLRNLLSNAVKFTSVGGVTLRVRPADARDWLRFEVRDTGIGVPAGQVDRLFAPFEQGDAAISARYGGTGLGLAISRRLTQAMGGRIGVTSREGLGATFHVDLPLPATSAAPVARPALAPRPQASAPRPLPPLPRRGGAAMRVLVADDSPYALLLAQAYLDGVPGVAMPIDAVQDGAAALRRFEAEAYDVVLMDLQMPVQSGADTARQMRASEQRRRRPRALLVAVSGEIDPAVLEQALASGFDTWLGKPYSRAQLLALLRLDGPDRAEPPPLTPGVPVAVPDEPRLQRLRALPDSDLPQAIERLGSARLYGQVVLAATEPLLRFEARLAAALDTVPCDLARAQSVVHDLISIAATLGLLGLSADARALERCLATTTTPTEDPALAGARQAVAQRLAGLRQALDAEAGL